jgi:ABC-type multidrug transport system fused ATPase/permease subunit
VNRKKYYGLRIMSGFYKSMAVILVIVSIAFMGVLAADAFLTTQTVNDVTGTGAAISWAGQALVVLVIGGLSALTCYVLGQLIDAQIATHDNTLEILEHLENIDLQDKKTDELLQKQIRMIRAVYADKDDAADNVNIPVNRSR